VAVWGKGGQATPHPINSTLSSGPNHDICHQETSLLVYPLVMLHGYLWLEETIPIIAEHIPRISWLPCVGRDAAEIVGTSGNLTIDDCRNRMQWRKKVIALPSVWGKPFA